MQETITVAAFIKWYVQSLHKPRGCTLHKPTVVLHKAMASLPNHTSDAIRQMQLLSTERSTAAAPATTTYVTRHVHVLQAQSDRYIAFAPLCADMPPLCQSMVMQCPQE